MPVSFLTSLAVSLGLTLVLELAFALVWCVRGRGLVLVALMNLLTNPTVVTLHWVAVRLLGLPPVPVTAILELAAVAAEGFCCRGVIRRPWVFAFLINLFSFSAGALLQAFLH